MTIVIEQHVAPCGGCFYLLCVGGTELPGIFRGAERVH
jgi:hypothetical protein